MSNNKTDKKVAFLIQSYLPITQNWIYNQLNNLRNWQGVVITEETLNMDLFGKGYEFYSREKRNRFFQNLDTVLKKKFCFSPFVHRCLSVENLDIIHAHFGNEGYYMLNLARFWNLPLVTTFYGFDISLMPTQYPVWEKRYKKLFKWGSLFLVEGSNMGKKVEQLGCPSEKIKVLHIGVDPEAYNYSIPDYQSGDPIDILMVGRFVEKKGFRDGLRAFRHFIKQGGKGKLTLIGGAADLDRSREIEQKIKLLLEDDVCKAHVDYVGKVRPQRLKQEYAKHDLLLVPSKHAANGDCEGGSPVSILEAEASGTPVVGTRHCDIVETVVESKTGLLADEGDIEGLAELLFMFYRGEVDIQKMGKNGRDHIEKNYNVRSQGKKLERIYDNLFNV